jgi:MFS family permease
LRSRFSQMLPWLMWLTAALFYFYVFMLRMVPSLISTTILETFSLTPLQLAQIVSIYYLVYAVMQVPIGLIIDRYGLRRSLTLGSACCALSSIGFISLHYYPILLISRLLLGFGSAFAFIGAMKIIRVRIGDKHIGLLSSLTNTIGMLGASCAFTVLTPQIRHHGWPRVATFLVLVSLLLCLSLYAIIRDVNNEADSQQTASIKQLYQQTWGLIRQHPLLLLNGLIACLCALPTTCFADLWANLYFRQGLGFDEMAAASATSCIFLGWAIGSPCFGRCADYFRNYHKPLIVGIIGIFVLFFIILTVQPESVGSLLLLCTLFGALASCQTLVFPIACQLSPVQATATAIALTNAMVVSGSLLFQPLVAWLIQSQEPITFAHPSYTLGTYQYALSSLLIATVLCLGLAVLQYHLYQQQGRRT